MPKDDLPAPVGNYLFHLLVAIGRQRDRDLERELKLTGLTVALHRALGVVASFEPCTMSELSDFSMVDRTTLTRIADQLVKMGLVSREATPLDRRQVVLRMTEAGRAKQKESGAIVVAWNRHMLDGIPEEMQRAMAVTSQMIVANWGAGADMTERVLTFRRPVANAPPPPPTAAGRGRRGKTA